MRSDIIMSNVWPAPYNRVAGSVVLREIEDIDMSITYRVVANIGGVGGKFFLSNYYTRPEAARGDKLAYDTVRDALFPRDRQETERYLESERPVRKLEWVDDPCTCPSSASAYTASSAYASASAYASQTGTDPVVDTSTLKYYARLNATGVPYGWDSVEA